MTTIKNLLSMTKRILLSSIACLAFSITISAQGTQPEAGRYISKTFKVCPFNVDGLPKKFGFINVNPDGKGAEGAKTIGQYINQSDIDFWGLSEDFNYHNDLANEITDGKYQIGTYRGGINLNQFKLNMQFDTDGLNFLSKTPNSFSDESWVKWNKCNGWANHGNDEMIRKGYRHYLADLGDGIKIDFYIMHMDADTGEKDNAARADQWKQLYNAIVANTNGSPIIVMGDTNCRYTRDDIRGLFINPINQAGKYEVKDAWIEHCKNGIYPTLGSDALMVDQLGYKEGEIVDKVLYLNPTDGDCHIKALNFNVDSEFTVSDHRPVIVTMEVTSRDTTTGIDQNNTPALKGDKLEPSKVMGIYDVFGNKLPQLVKGINIVKMSNGEIRKINY